MNRRDFVLTMGKATAAVGGLSFQTCSNGEQEQAVTEAPERKFNVSSSVRRKPNIVFIVMDTARQDRFSCYGYPRETTPNIDRIAAEGTLFRRAIASSPWTVPTHASMFTGVYPSLHGSIGYTPHLDGAYPLIAEILREAGYETVGFSNNPFISETFGFTWGFEAFQEPRVTLQRNNQETGDKGSAYTNNLVRDWLGRRRDDRPFFLFINYLEPHQPLTELHDSYLRAFTNEPDLSATIEQLREENVLTYNYVNAGRVTWTMRHVELLNAFYDANMRYLDMRVGELVSLIRERDILDETLLIITSDHGENLFDHNMVDHMFCVYNTLINIPLIVRLPGTFQPGTRVDGLVQDIDIIPTIAELAGLTWDGRENLQGTSLLKPPTRQFAISEYCPFIMNMINVFLNSPKREFELHRLGSLKKAVVTADYKYIWHSFGFHELYAALDDPDEKNNLIDREPGKADELNSMLRDWLAALPERPARQTPPQAPGIQLTPERERQLRDLGYI
ncbi:sulfatase [Candidatus Latescibacterota bacterium]